MSESALYNQIGVHYNETRSADPYLVSRFRALLTPLAGANYLDIGCGTGNYTCALAAESYQFCGIDPSEIMLEKARQKTDCHVIWQKGTAEDLSFENEFFSGAICSLTIHHWQDLKKGFSEIHRVLKPKSKFVLFTAFPEQMEHYWLKHYFPRMMRDSTKQMPSFSIVKNALESANFEIAERENYFIKDDLRDHFLYCGKNRPELYLRVRVQRGISSFSTLANKDEVEIGLQHLAEDIRENRISGIIKNYKSVEGDYAFIIAETNV